MKRGLRVNAVVYRPSQGQNAGSNPAGATTDFALSASVLGFLRVMRQVLREMLRPLPASGPPVFGRFLGVREPGKAAPVPRMATICNHVRFDVGWPVIMSAWRLSGLFRASLARATRPHTGEGKDRMPSILVQGSQPEDHPASEGASPPQSALQQEVKELLGHAAGMLSMNEARRLSGRWRHRLGGRSFSDSVRLIREDRDSR
jgi:hypothetical protein